MRKNALFILVIIYVLSINSCYDKTYTNTKGPSKGESKRLITNTLKQLAYDPSSVKVWSVDEAVYTNEMKWIIPVDFSWTGMNGGPSRERWYFSITTGTLTLVNIIEDQKQARDLWSRYRYVKR